MIKDNNVNISLRNKHFLEWDNTIKEELKNLLIERLIKAFPIKKEDIVDILCTGSRVYKLPDNRNVFKDSSDLDITIIIKNKIFHKVFLPVNEMLASKIHIKKLMESKEHKGKFRPKLTGFLFYDVKVSVFIFDENSKYLGNFLHGYKLPFYSLFKRVYFENNVRHLLCYETNVKTRIPKYEYCFICLNKKESKNRLQFKIIYKDYIEENIDEHLKLHDIFICDECFMKLFGRGFDYFLDLIYYSIINRNDEKLNNILNISNKSIFKKIINWFKNLFKKRKK